MNNSNNSGPSAPRDLLAREWPRLVALTGDEAPRPWILVDVATQCLVLAHGPEPVLTRPVSTAQAGIDCRQDSGGTPRGLHRIRRKIGQGAATGTVFESRRPTGAVWKPGQADEPADLILTRILTLEGREEGVNRGPGVDSLERYIYIHGTNHEGAVGKPVSHGCVRLTNDHVVELFDQVNEGDAVLIV